MSNANIMSAVFSQLDTIGIPISYPSVEFKKPSSGFWLEVAFQPNRPIVVGLENSGAELPLGIFTVSVCSSTAESLFDYDPTINQIKALFPKGYILDGLTRISRAPYPMSADIKPDVTRIPVTISYVT